ncbi:MAG: hypothetical protein ACKPCJ_03895, partial [Betaproteobacteria bacterium]
MTRLTRPSANESHPATRHGLGHWAQRSLAGAALALASLMAAAPMAAHAQGTAPAVTLRWAAQNDILTLDPHSQNHSTTSAILMHAYEGLVRYDA